MSRRESRRATTLAFMALAFPAASQQVLQARAEYQPIAYTDTHGYKGCGIRASVVFESFPPGTVEGADLSINIWARPKPIGLVKVAALEASVRSGEPDLRKIRPAAFSLSEEKIGVPAPLDAVGPGEEPGYLIAATSVDAALDLLTAMVAGERLVVGVTRAGVNGERRLVFAAELSASDLRSFRACVAKAFAERG